VAWKGREDGAVLINRIWADDHMGYEDAGDHATPAQSKGLFDDPTFISWTPLGDGGEALFAPDAPRAPAGKKAISLASGSEELQNLRARNRELNRQHSLSQQSAAKFRKDALALERAKLELENQVKFLKMQLSSRSNPGPERPTNAGDRAGIVSVTESTSDSGAPDDLAGQ